MAIENETVRIMGLNEALSVSARMPYNSTAGLYRLCGIPLDNHKYGDDCVGQLKSLTKMLPQTYEVYYVNTRFKNRTHVAAIVDDTYVDPFLFQSTPIPLKDVRKEGKVSVSTYAAGKRVEATWEQVLRVQLIQTFSPGQERVLLEYKYDLNARTRDLPSDEVVFAPGSQQQFNFVSENGCAIRVMYAPIQDELRRFMFNCDSGKITGTLEEYAETSLNSLYGLSQKELQDCFRGAKELERFISWNIGKKESML